MKKSSAYEDRLKEELARLQMLDTLASKVQTECDSMKKTLESIDERVELFELEGGASAEEDEVSELQGKLQVHQSLFPLPQ